LEKKNLTKEYQMINTINILDMTSNDLEVLENIFNFNKGLDTKTESYKIEMLELEENTLKIYYIHDFYDENKKPTLNHHIERIDIDLIYKKIEDKLNKKHSLKLDSKIIKGHDFSSFYLVDVLLADDKIYFQVEDSKLKAYIRVYEWSLKNILNEYDEVKKI